MEPEVFILLDMARRCKSENRVMSEKLENLFHANKEKIIDHVCKNFNQENAETLQYFRVV